MKASVVFKRLYNAMNETVDDIDIDGNPCKRRKYNIFALEGSTRSTKTFSIIQAIDLYCRENPHITDVQAFRKHRKNAGDTILKSIKEYATKTNQFDHSRIRDNNKEMSYRLDGCKINLNGLDDPQKAHGLGSQIAWLNESMEYEIEECRQIQNRNTEFTIYDWNPSIPNHWIFKRLKNRDDVYYDHSTFLDNPFLADKQYKEILAYQPTPENIANGTADIRQWKIYGLGLRYQDSGVCIKNVEFVDEYPDNCKDESVGLDFGYTSDPTTCEKTGVSDGWLYIDELFYEYGLNNDQIATRLIQENLGELEVIADSSEPKSIDTIYDFCIERNNFVNIHGARKGSDSVRHGIDFINSKYKGVRIVRKPWHEGEKSGIASEVYTYVFKKNKDGKPLSEPIDKHNHGWDAVRYAREKYMEQFELIVL